MKRDAPLKIGTRGSLLALWQARRVAALIQERLIRSTEIVVIETEGDRNDCTPIEAVGEMGVFTKDIEQALIDGRIDLAVHSLKDLPTRLPDGLVLAAVPERADPHDVLLSRLSLEALPSGARVGTSSRRRRVQLEALRPDLVIEEIRGNVPTRIEKYRCGEYDAIVLAAAGIDRLAIPLDFEVRRFDLPLSYFLPAPGQGVLAVETRIGDQDMFRPLDNPKIATCVAAERRLLQLIEGGCSVPLGAYAHLLEEGRIELSALLAVGKRLRRALVRAVTPEDAAGLAFKILCPDPFPVPMPNRLLGKRVLITREDPDLAEALTAAGALVRITPVIRIVPLLQRPDLPSCRWMLVTSPNVVPLLHGVQSQRVGAIGAGTAEALARIGIPVDLIAERPYSSGLADSFLALNEPKGTSVLLPAARDGDREIDNRLVAAGYDVRRVVLYDTHHLDPDLGNADVVIFSSPSSVRPVNAAVVAIGAKTAEAARNLGLQVTVAARPTRMGLATAVEESVRRTKS